TSAARISAPAEPPTEIPPKIHAATASAAASTAHAASMRSGNGMRRSYPVRLGASASSSKGKREESVPGTLSSLEHVSSSSTRVRAEDVAEVVVAVAWLAIWGWIEGCEQGPELGRCASTEVVRLRAGDDPGLWTAC